MQFYYGAQNILRALDECEFWKHQEAEHAGLIPVVVPGLEAAYTQALEQFGTELALMQSEAVRYIESVTRAKGAVGQGLKSQMIDLVRRCAEQSESFVKLMGEMLQNSRAVRANQAAVSVIRHMVRESQYFIGIVQLIL